MIHHHRWTWVGWYGKLFRHCYGCDKWQVKTPWLLWTRWQNNNGPNPRA